MQVNFKDLIHILKFLLSLIPAMIYKLIRKNLYLVCEYPSGAHDNGYWFFKFVRENYPNEDIVYAIKKKSHEYNQVKNLGEVVQFGSIKHWIYFLSAKANISTQKGGKPNAAICYLLEVVFKIVHVKNVFLQHGVTVNNLSYLHANNAKIDLFVCSTDAEYEFIKENFGYDESVLKKVGMCRFDSLDGEKINYRKVLIAPTWRKWLGDIKDADKFMETEYFLSWQSVISDKRFLDIIDKHQLEVYFYLHVHVARFAECFENADSRIKIMTWENSNLQKLVNECCYMVTDYSSTIIDFCYTNKRSVYYQFDYDEYRNRHQAQGYFNYEVDGFGSVCYTKERLLRDIQSAAKNGFMNPVKYERRISTFFIFRDKLNCERTYNAVKEFIG